MTKAVHAIITGRVQGVFYRAWTETEAKKHQLRGWVRNRRDDSVEAVFAGKDADVDDMIDACREGPPSAQVTDIKVDEADTADIPDSFEVRPGA
ncbi:MAG: acylphosphatase [Pseudomonadales bacterium]